MRAIDNVTGSVLVGEVRGNQFVVQDGPDFDPRFEVYDMSEVSLVAAAMMADAVDFPTELDNDFSDADMIARENIANDIAAAQEEQELQKLVSEFLVAGVKYMEAIDNALAAVEYAAVDYWESKESA